MGTRTSQPRRFFRGSQAREGMWPWPQTRVPAGRSPPIPDAILCDHKSPRSSLRDVACGLILSQGASESKVSRLNLTRHPSEAERVPPPSASLPRGLWGGAPPRPILREAAQRVLRLMRFRGEGCARLRRHPHRPPFTSPCAQAPPEVSDPGTQVLGDTLATKLRRCFNDRL